MKLGLGTVQFGLPYGIAHKGGATLQHEIERILEGACEAGIDCLDTAPLYEESEARLGRALNGHARFRIVTKTPAFNGGAIVPSDAAALRSTFMRSLERLRQERLYGLLIHHADDVLKPGGELLVQAMRELVRAGVVEKLGVSVYTADELDRVLDLFEPGIVQLPINVLDQRFIASGHLDLLNRRGIEVHARSIFLQGVLLMDPVELAPFFAPLRATLADYAAALAAHGMSRVEGALAFIRHVDGVDYAIVGAQDARELREIVDASVAPRTGRFEFARYAVADENMILPPRWKT